MGIAGMGFAAGGTADAIQNLIEQRMQQARLAETVRANQASEALRSRALDQQQQYQNLLLDERRQQQADRSAQIGTSSMAAGTRVTGPQYQKDYANTVEAPNFGPEMTQPQTLPSVQMAQALTPGATAPTSGGLDVKVSQPQAYGTPQPTGNMLYLGKPEYQEQQREAAALANFQPKAGETPLETRVRLYQIAPHLNVTPEMITGGARTEEWVTMPGQKTPMRAIRDKEGQLYTPSGQNITNTPGIMPYKPDKPDHVLIQTGNGYMTREQALALLASGGQVPLATTAGTRQQMETAQTLAPHVPKVMDQAKEVAQLGLFGPVMSRVRDLAAKLGTVNGLASDNLDEQQAAMQKLGDAVRANTEGIRNDKGISNDRLVGRFLSNLGLLMTGAARVHGGAKGGGSPQMLEHFKDLFGATGSLDMFLGRMDTLGDYIDNYAKGPANAATSGGPKQPAAAPAAPVDPLMELFKGWQGQVPRGR